MTPSLGVMSRVTYCAYRARLVLHAGRSPLVDTKYIQKPACELSNIERNMQVNSQSVDGLESSVILGICKEKGTVQGFQRPSLDMGAIL